MWLLVRYFVGVLMSILYHVRTDQHGIIFRCTNVISIFLFFRLWNLSQAKGSPSYRVVFEKLVFFSSCVEWSTLNLLPCAKFRSSYYNFYCISPAYAHGFFFPHLCLYLCILFIYCLINIQYLSIPTLVISAFWFGTLAIVFQ